jgi:MFS transporter, DHA2 family, multidrug resistance protein
LLNRAPSWGLSSPASMISLVSAVVLFALFVARERASRSPIVPPSAYRDAATRRALAARAVLYSVYMGSFLVLPLVLLDAGRSLAETALMLSPRPIMMGVFGPIATRVIGRFGLGRVAIGGAAGIALGLGILPFYDPRASILPLMIALVSMGTGLGAAQVATATVVTARSKHDDLGAASATITITTAIAGALGMAGLLGLATNPAYGPRVSFSVAAAVGVVGVVLSLMLERSLAAQAPSSRRSHASPSSG